MIWCLVLGAWCRVNNKQNKERMRMNKKVKVEGEGEQRNLADSTLSEEERHEAATEAPVGEVKPEGEGEQRNVPLAHFPSGADGVEPAKAKNTNLTNSTNKTNPSNPLNPSNPCLKVSEEAKKELEDSYLAMRGRLDKIADLALAADAKCGVSGRIVENWRTCSKAIAEIRRICKQSFAEEFVPDYEWLARIVTGDHFEPECLAKAIEAEASKRLIEYPTFYTPGWLCDLAKRLQGNTVPAASSLRGAGKDGAVAVTEPRGEDAAGTVRKPSMDFGRFRVVRFAIPGLTQLSFRRKQEKLDESGSLVKGRIIVAEIRKRKVGGEKLVNGFTVKSYEPGEAARVLYAGDSWVSMSKTEKMVYKMVKTDIKETQRRRIRRKRARAAAAKAAAEKEVK